MHLNICKYTDWLKAEMKVNATSQSIVSVLVLLSSLGGCGGHSLEVAADGWTGTAHSWLQSQGTRTLSLIFYLNMRLKILTLSLLSLSVCYSQFVEVSIINFVSFILNKVIKLGNRWCWKGSETTSSRIWGWRCCWGRGWDCRVSSNHYHNNWRAMDPSWWKGTNKILFWKWKAS